MTRMTLWIDPMTRITMQLRSAGHWGRHPHDPPPPPRPQKYWGYLGNGLACSPGVPTDDDYCCVNSGCFAEEDERVRGEERSW